jgi:hypothetical protein
MTRPSQAGKGAPRLLPAAEATGDVAACDLLVHVYALVDDTIQHDTVLAQ